MAKKKKNIPKTLRRKSRNPTHKVVGQKYDRPSWDEYFIEIMEAVSKRATCDRGRAAAVIVKSRQILTTGYVGSAVGAPHCDEVGHDMRKFIDDVGNISEHCVRTVHAEQNAICQAAKYGIQIEGATIYMRMEPCSTCAKMIVNAGIKEVVCQRHYHAAEESRKIFKKAKVKLKVLENKIQQYERQ